MGEAQELHDCVHSVSDQQLGSFEEIRTYWNRVCICLYGLKGGPNRKKQHTFPSKVGGTSEDSKSAAILGPTRLHKKAEISDLPVWLWNLPRWHQDLNKMTGDFGVHMVRVWVLHMLFLNSSWNGLRVFRGSGRGFGQNPNLILPGPAGNLVVCVVMLCVYTYPMNIGVFGHHRQLRLSSRSRTPTSPSNRRLKEPSALIAHRNVKAERKQQPKARAKPFQSYQSFIGNLVSRLGMCGLHILHKWDAKKSSDWNHPISTRWHQRWQPTPATTVVTRSSVYTDDGWTWPRRQRRHQLRILKRSWSLAMQMTSGNGNVIATVSGTYF